MNKKGEIIGTVLGIIGIVAVLFVVLQLFESDKIKISYVVPLPIGSLSVQFGPSLIQQIEQKYDSLKSKLPLKDYEIIEGRPFAIEFSFTSTDKLENTTLEINHNSKLGNFILEDK